MHKNNFLALLILAAMSLLLLGSAWNDSATFDEVAHIPSGFGAVTQLDARLNPEHPPLVKALSAAVAQIAVRPYFPTNTQAWQNDINGQWDQGRIFLYESGNDADKILFWSRVPVMALSLLLGVLLFWWTKKRFGRTPALATLALYAFSPTVIAHSRYVTTDIGAALGFFIGIIAFVRFLESPTKKNLLAAGIAFGIAQLLKFSLILLVPMYAILIMLWVFSREYQTFFERLRSAAALALKTAGVCVIGIGTIWIVYGLFTWNYPQEKQRRDAETILSNNPARPLVEFDLALAENRITRPLAYYGLGVLMANQRAAGGNTTYFLGEVSSKGSRLYFPLVYLVKEPLALHILSLAALIIAGAYSLRFFRTDSTSPYSRARRIIRMHFPEVAALVCIGTYWGVSVISPLNIGVRHVLPTFPFIFFLIGRILGAWTEEQRARTRLLAGTAGGLLIAWLIAGTAAAFPHYLSYYNALGGGTENGYRIAVDSNYDWGQDLKRLRDFMQERGIKKISLDYFGGGSPRYYLGDSFEPWWSGRGPASGWFAVSATIREGAFGSVGPGFERKPEDAYEWLKGHQPVATAGTSIFIYEFPEPHK
ncbi:MAG: glycosyltransferase family 39 protein [Candidatus Sungbacteria bacterium]|nr:glycosyltransferase family 39 protein [Candidatus Sungbacteria bacterium]